MFPVLMKQDEIAGYKKKRKRKAKHALIPALQIA